MGFDKSESFRYIVPWTEIVQYTHSVSYEISKWVFVVLFGVWLYNASWTNEKIYLPYNLYYKTPY